MSKAEVLRGFVRERLAAAAQEITEVVDRIVAGYEEEASDLRQEIGRQRRQLEVLRRTGRSPKGAEFRKKFLEFDIELIFPGNYKDKVTEPESTS